MSSRDNRNRNRSRSRPQRRWNRCPTTGRLQRIDDESSTRSNRNRNREQSTSRSRSRSRERGGRNNPIGSNNNATRTDNNRLNTNTNFMERFLQDMFGDNFQNHNQNLNRNHNNHEQKTNENQLPPIPDNFDEELEATLGLHGARLFEESARLTTRQMDRSQSQDSEIPLFVSSLIRDYLRLRAINSITNDDERRRSLRSYQRDLIERQMAETNEHAVIGTDIAVLRQALNNLRSMMYDTSTQVGRNQFTLQLTIDINNVPTKFEGITVSRLEIPEEQHRKITEKEEDDNKDNDGFECGICIERFKKTEFVTTLKDCRHQFHRHCVSQWIKDKGLCPFCRGKVIQFKCESNIGTVYI